MSIDSDGELLDIRTSLQRLKKAMEGWLASLKFCQNNLLMRMIPVEENLPQVISQIERYIADTIKAEHLPGLAIGILHQDTIVFAKGYGFANVRKQVPVTPETVFRIGSITKSFTAVAIMQQWEQGKFQLDDPIMNYLPAGHKPIHSKNPTASPVTFRHLLTHTSGIGELKAYSDILHLGTGMYFISPAKGRLRPLKDIYKMGVTTDVPPGTKWAYANHGYALIGYLLELISNETYHEYILRHILEPLKMDHSDVVRSDRVNAQLAEGYKVQGTGKTSPKKYIDSWIRPAGNMMASLNDLFKFAQCILHKGALDGQRLLKAETVDLMFHPHHQLDPRLGGYGFGFYADFLGPHRVMWHGGHTIGFNCSFILIPSEQIGIIILVNTTRKKMGYILGREIARQVLGVEKPLTHLEQSPLLHKIPMDLVAYTGTYGVTKGFLTNIRPFLGAGEFRIRMQGDHLLLRGLWGSKRRGVRLWHARSSDPDEYYIVDDVDVYTMDTHETIIFQRDPGTKQVIAFKRGFLLWMRQEGVHTLKFKLVVMILVVITLVILGVIGRIMFP